MMSSKEAWAILEERCWWKSRTNEDDRESVQAEQYAARALVLVALEEFNVAAGKDIGNAIKGRRTDHMGVVRARIAALGASGDGT
jgi:hypothetical protein